MANQNFKVKKGLEVGTGVTISDSNINISGIITATQFAGDGSALTGVTAAGSGVVVQEEGSNVGTAATINFIGSNVTAALSGGIANVTVSAGGLSNVVEDTTPQLGGNLDLNSKDITGTGNISITGGFNATGVSTFQENVVFQSTASFGDNDKINAGAGNDLQIYHNGTNSFIDNTTGSLLIRGANGNHVRIQSPSGEESIVAAANGSVDLYYDNSKKLETTNTGVTVTGTLAATAVTGDGSGLTGLPAAGISDVVADTTPQLGGNLDANSKDITGIANLNVAGVSTFQGNVNLGDSDKAIFGAGQDLQIYHNGTDSIIADVGEGNLNILGDADVAIINAASTEYKARFTSDGAAELYYNGAKKLETTNTGVTVTGTLAATAVTGSGSGLTGLTGASAGTYGSSSAVPIITVDSNGRITGVSTTGVSGGGGGGGIDNIVQDTTPQLGGDLDLNGNDISGTGNIDITGYAAVSGVTTFSGTAGFGTHITLPDHAQIQIGGATGGDLKIYHDGSHSRIIDSGTGSLISQASRFSVHSANDSETMIDAVENSYVRLYHDNALRLATTDTGVSITDNLNVAGVSTFVGAVTFNGNLDLQDNDKILLGTGDDLEIYHDGSDSYIDDSGDGSLRIRASQVNIDKYTGEALARFRSDSSCELFFDNSSKLITTNTGVTVTGALTATTIVKSGGSSSQYLMADGSVSTTVGISTAFSNVQATWSVNSSGSSSYRFTGPGNDGTDDNPDLYLVRGQRYRFTNNSGGSHPFQIRSSPGGSAYSTGVTNNGAASGNIDFNVQHDAPARLYYQCTAHSGMVGNIYITGGGQWQNTAVAASGTPEIYTDYAVGIGTDNPLNGLDILQSDGRTRVTAFGHIITQNHNNSTTNYWSFAPRNGGELDIGYGAADGNGTVDADKVTITTAGLVGIGTVNPGTHLHVFDGASTGRIRIQGGGSSSAQLQLIGGGQTNPFVITQDSSRNLIFYDHTSERLRIDSSGRLLVGTDTAVKNANRLSGNKIALVGTGSNYPSAIITSYATANVDAGPIMEMQKSRGETDGSMVKVEDNDRLGNLQFLGSDGTNFIRGAAIAGYVDGTTGTNDMPGRLIFSTTADGASVPTERLRITSAGYLGINDTSPPWPLSIRKAVSGGTVSGGAGIFMGIQDNYPAIQMNTASDAHGCIIDMGYSGVDFKGRIEYVNGDDYMRFFANSVERLRITSAGRFGFHTGSPDAEVHIEPVTGGSNASIVLSNDGRSQWFRIQNQEADDAFTINANDTAERFRISSTGQIGMGKAGAVTVNGNSPLTIQESDSNSETICLRATNSGGNGSQPGIVMKTAAGGHIGGIYCDVNSDYLRISTSGTDRIYVSNTGEVTKPYQPRFLAKLSANTTYAPSSFGNYIDFDSEEYDVGDNFTTSGTDQGLFTAPVAGLYQFTASAYGASVAWTQSWFTVNGSRKNYTDWVLSGTGDFVQNSQAIYLNAGDKVGFHPHRSGTSSYTVYANVHHTYFSGYLIG